MHWISSAEPVLLRNIEMSFAGSLKPILAVISGSFERWQLERSVPSSFAETGWVRSGGCSPVLRGSSNQLHGILLTTKFILQRKIELHQDLADGVGYLIVMESSGVSNGC